jgi:uncharacterized protein YegL
MVERIGAITETKRFEQLGILVLDSSPSMQVPGETGAAKTEEVGSAVRDLILRMRSSRLRSNFFLAILSYDEKVRGLLPPTPVAQIAELDELVAYNSNSEHGSGTAMGDALEAASRVAQDFLSNQNTIPRSAVVVLMTDGQNTTGKDPAQVAKTIKNSGQRISICAAGYGKDIDELGLKKIVSTANGYKHTYNIEELRQFFEASISVVSG